jgi:flagellar hook-associated protein 1 FlgK
MSLSFALGNALTGLTASARMAEVVAANVANSQTDGYGRRVVDLSAQSLGGRGAGVRIDGITRIGDPALLFDRRGAEAQLAAGNQRLGALERIEAVWGIGTDGATIDARIAALEDALIAASGDPSSDIRLTTVVSRLNDLAGAVRGNSDAIRQERERADARIGTEVDTLNTALGQVEFLNSQIGKARAAGEDAHALVDERQRVIDRISAIVPVREVERDRGTVALYTTTGITLVDGRAAEIGFSPTPTIVADMTFAGGALGGLTLNGQPMPGTGGAGRMTGGSLAASFALRDEVLPAQQAALDAVARDLIDRFQDVTTDPTLAPGDAGLLTDGGTAFDPLDEVGLAGRLTVNAAVDPAAGGALFRLRDGVNAVTAGPVGRATQLDAWADALTDQRPLASGGTARSAAGHAAAVAGALGSARLTAEDEMGFASARYNGLRERELGLGVDTDAEMQTLLLIEQSYAANARVIETVDFLIRQLMEI